MEVQREKIFYLIYPGLSHNVARATASALSNWPRGCQVLGLFQSWPGVGLNKGDVPPLKRFLPRARARGRAQQSWAHHKRSLEYPKTILSIPIFHLKKYLPENFKKALGLPNGLEILLLQEPSEVKISCSDLKTRLGAKAPALV